jgi:predicted secreted protein
MTQATTLKFGQFLVKLGNGASPEVFAAPCGLNTRSFNLTAAANETNVPDCDNPDAASWLERDITSLSRSITGAGIVADEDFDTWNDWAESGDSKNVQITLGTRTWQGPFKCTRLNVTGDRGSRVKFDVTLDSDGEIVKQ